MKALRVYVGAQSADVDAAAAAIKSLTENGVRVTHDWTYSVRKAALGQLSGHDRPGDNELSAAAYGDVYGIDRCDVFWLIAPQGHSGSGAWFEFGCAWALKKITIVSGEFDTNIFCRLASRRIVAHADALELILEMQMARIDGHVPPRLTT